MTDPEISANQGPSGAQEQVVRIQLEHTSGQAAEASSGNRGAERARSLKILLTKTAVYGAIGVGGVYGAVWIGEKIGGLGSEVAGAVKGVVEDGVGAIGDGAGAVIGGIGDGAGAVIGGIGSVFDGKTAEASLSAEMKNARFPDDINLFKANIYGKSYVNLPLNLGGLKAPLGAGNKEARARRTGSLLITAKGSEERPAVKLRVEDGRIKAEVNAYSLHSHLLDSRLPVHEKGDKKGQIIPDEGGDGLIVRVANVLPFAKSKQAERTSTLGDLTQQHIRSSCAELARPHLIPFTREYTHSNYAAQGKDKLAKAPVDVSFVNSKGREVGVNTLNLHRGPKITKKSLAKAYDVDEDDVDLEQAGCKPDPKTTRLLAQQKLASTQNLRR